MPLYSVKGAGAYEIFVEAFDAREAGDIARSKGIVVESVSCPVETLADWRLRHIDENIRSIRRWIIFVGVVLLILALMHAGSR